LGVIFFTREFAPAIWRVGEQEFRIMSVKQNGGMVLERLYRAWVALNEFMTVPLWAALAHRRVRAAAAARARRAHATHQGRPHKRGELLDAGYTHCARRVLS
jgi:hypothetical protein